MVSPLVGLLPAHAAEPGEPARFGDLAGEAHVTAVAAPGDHLLALSSNTGAEEVALRLLTSAGAPDAGFDADGLLTLGTAAADVPRDLVWSRAGDRAYVLADSGSAATIWAVRTDGTLDPTFGSDGVASLAGADGRRIAVDDRGRIVVAGANAAGAATAWRLSAAGAPDASFGTGGAATGAASSSYDSVATALGNDVYLGYTAGSETRVVKLDAAGNPESSYGTAGTATLDGPGNAERAEVVLQDRHRASGELAVVVTARAGGGTSVARLTDVGTKDTTFSAAAAVDGLQEPGRATVLVDDEQLVLAGATAAGDPQLVQLGRDGAASSDLAGDGSWTDARVDGAVAAISVLPDGSYLASGQPATGQAFVYRVAGTEVPKCGGRYATIVGTDGKDLVGTSLADVIRGSAGAEFVRGRPGDDVICGGPGNDRLNGGSGVDSLNGSRGDDDVNGGPDAGTLRGGPGRDHLVGGSAVDTIKGGPGEDRARGKKGDDSLFGGTGDDHLRGSKGDDTVRGRPGDDVLRGGPGDDELGGGKGNDHLWGGQGADRLRGGPGVDLRFQH